MKRFEGKTVLVVGAGSVTEGWGNGRASSVLYAREGAHVICCDINIEAARMTQELVRAEDGTCDIHQVDVTSEESVAALFAAIAATHPNIHVLHNNVGFAAPGTTHLSSLADWERIFAANARGTFLTCRSAIPVMLAQGGGAIVNIASISALRFLGRPMASYAASKGAVVQFTREIALEYAAQGIRANVVTPGYMDTPAIIAPYKDMQGGDLEKVTALRHAACPMGHMGNAWDIAHAAAFLASDHARYITAQNIVVDGGLTESIGFKV